MFLFRSEEHTSELQSQSNLVCRLLLEKKKANLDIKALAGGTSFSLTVEKLQALATAVKPPAGVCAEWRHRPTGWRGHLSRRPCPAALHASRTVHRKFRVR